MKLGLLLTAMAGPAADAGSVVALGREADNRGFDSVWVHDHVAVPVAAEASAASGPPAFEALTLVSALAAATSDLAIGTAVLALPFRHPAMVAKMLATADRLSGGRVVLGVGTGADRAEFDALGLPEGYFERRGDVSNEYLRAIKEMWTSTGPSSFSGQFVSFADVGTFPKPVQQPHPPIVVAGEGERALRRASCHGTGYMAMGTSPAKLAERVAHLRDVCRRDRRDPDEIEVHMLSRVSLSEQAAGPDRRLLTGSIDQVWEDLRRYALAGLDHLIMIPQMDGIEDREASARSGTERIATELLPAFGRRPALAAR